MVVAYPANNVALDPLSKAIVSAQNIINNSKSGSKSGKSGGAIAIELNSVLGGNLTPQELASLAKAFDSGDYIQTLVQVVQDSSSRKLKSGTSPTSNSALNSALNTVVSPSSGVTSGVRSGAVSGRTSSTVTDTYGTTDGAPDFNNWAQKTGDFFKNSPLVPAALRGLLGDPFGAGIKFFKDAYKVYKGGGTEALKKWMVGQGIPLTE